MTWIAIAVLLIMAGVLFWQYMRNVELAERNDVLRMAAADRKVRVEFMHRELSGLFKDGNYKKKVYLCGILDCLENELGTKPYTQFWGWVMANKMSNRKAKNIDIP